MRKTPNPKAKKKVAKAPPGMSGLPQIDGAMSTLPDGRTIACVAKVLVPESAKKKHRRHSYCNHAAQAIIANVLRGHWVTAAAKLAGYSRTTLAAWRREFPDFDMAIERAEVVHTDGLLAQAHFHAVMDPATCLKLLAIRHPEWAATEKKDVNVSGHLGVVPLNIVPEIHRERARKDGLLIEDKED